MSTVYLSGWVVVMSAGALTLIAWVAAYVVRP